MLSNLRNFMEACEVEMKHESDCKKVVKAKAFQHSDYVTKNLLLPDGETMSSTTGNALAVCRT